EQRARDADSDDAHDPVFVHGPSRPITIIRRRRPVSCRREASSGHRPGRDPRAGSWIDACRMPSWVPSLATRERAPVSLVELLDTPSVTPPERARRIGGPARGTREHRAMPGDAPLEKPSLLSDFAWFLKHEKRWWIGFLVTIVIALSIF